MSNVVRGDVERFCLSLDPTCTGINPCRLCWEFVRDSVLPPAMRAGGNTATPGQTAAFAREYNREWLRILMGVRQEEPLLFSKMIDFRHEQLNQEWQAAERLGVPPPLTPFGVIALQVIQERAAAPAAPPVAAPSTVPTNATPFSQETTVEDGRMARGDVREILRNGKPRPSKESRVNVGAKSKRVSLESKGEAPLLDEPANGAHIEPIHPIPPDSEPELEGDDVS